MAFLPVFIHIPPPERGKISLSPDRERASPAALPLLTLLFRGKQAVELLVKKLGEDENNLNKAIGNLVKKGLPEKIQKALDSVRVIGNNAVHPGKINIEDKPEIANVLFGLVNFITEKMIRDDQTVDKIFSSLPENAIKKTKQRDGQ